MKFKIDDLVIYEGHGLREECQIVNISHHGILLKPLYPCEMSFVVTKNSGIYRDDKSLLGVEVLNLYGFEYNLKHLRYIANRLSKKLYPTWEEKDGYLYPKIS